MRLLTIVSRNALWAAACCTPCSLLVWQANAQAPPPLDTSGAWFKPSLEVDDDTPLCAEVLAAASREFFARDEFHPTVAATDFSPRLEPVDFDSFPAQQPPANAVVETQGRPQPPQHVVTVEGQPIYLTRLFHAGCGGTCDSNVYHASARPLTVALDPFGDRTADAHEVDVPEYAHAWFKTADGRYFVGYRDFRSQRDGRALARLTVDGSWRETCRTNSIPAALDKVDDARVREALTSVHALDDAAQAVSGDEGFCGTAHFLGNVNFYRRQLLERALYRPWATAGTESRMKPAADANLAKLDLWAANGLFQRDALARYIAQRTTTLAALTKLYSARFGWAGSDATSAAETAVIAVDASFVFPSNGDPYAASVDARALRRAILEHRPLEEIRALDPKLPVIDGDTDGHHESVLSAAVIYPEALRYLLERGANPSRPNDFGKTPLMYAAQRNALEGAQLLLDHGADPNARTQQPLDTCYYRLSRTSVTALHYAVRYASTKLVELLVQKGAAPNIPAKPDSGGLTDEYPLDWLARYNSAESAERNPNIKPTEVPGLKAMLTPPDTGSSRR